MRLFIIACISSLCVAIKQDTAEQRPPMPLIKKEEVLALMEFAGKLEKLKKLVEAAQKVKERSEA